MSQNLIELLKRHGDGDGRNGTRRSAEGGRRARRGDRRRPPAGRGADRAARGDRLRRLDVLRRPDPAAREAARPRVHGHRVLGGGLRRPRRDGSSRSSAPRSTAARTTASVALVETVCLGFCHSSPSFRDGDVVDAGPGALERVLAGAPVEAPEPEWESALDEPVLLQPGDWSGLRRALAELTPEAVLEEVKAANLRGRGGAGFPAGMKWEFARNAPATPKFIVVNGDEGDPGSYIDKLPDGAEPGAAARGHGDRRLRRRRGARATSTCAPSTRARSPPSTRPCERAYDERPPRRRHLRQRLLLPRPRRRKAPARTSSARRRRSSTRCTGCAAWSPRGRRFPPSAATTRCRRSSTTSRRSATRRSSRATVPRRTRRSAPARRPARSSSA